MKRKGFRSTLGLATRRSDLIKMDKRNRESSIYFVRVGLDGPIKIGSTTNMKKRLKNLQVSNPIPLNVMSVVPGTERDEQRLHQKFSHLFIQGEWFHPGDDLLEFIDIVKERNCLTLGDDDGKQEK